MSEDFSISQLDELLDLRAYVKELETARDRAWRVRIRDVQEGRFTMESPIFRGFVVACHEIFEDSGAENYLSFETNFTPEGETEDRAYSFRIQRRDGATPEAQAARYRDRISALEYENKALREENSSLRASVPQWRPIDEAAKDGCRDVHLWAPGDLVRVGWWNGHSWEDNEIEGFSPTHYAELPAPPSLTKEDPTA